MYDITRNQPHRAHTLRARRVTNTVRDGRNLSRRSTHRVHNACSPRAVLHAQPSVGAPRLYFATDCTMPRRVARRRVRWHRSRDTARVSIRDYLQQHRGGCVCRMLQSRARWRAKCPSNANDSFAKCVEHGPRGRCAKPNFL